MEQPIEPEYKSEPGLYAIEFDSNDDEPMVQIGKSLDGPASRCNHHKKKGKNHKLKHWVWHSFPKALESDVHMLMSPHLVPCVRDPTKKKGIYCSNESNYNDFINKI